ncbi:MAG: hypothetical protein ABWY02_13345, partial [Telluria sp.]
NCLQMKACHAAQALCAGRADGEASLVQSARNTLLRCTILVKIKSGKAEMDCFGARLDGERMGYRCGAASRFVGWTASPSTRSTGTKSGAQAFQP